ncbi:MAG: peptidase S41, partial [Alphaproteobacteria bacterium]|nr:peptidase S41 [Alphaproteobacteria bacterium]
RSVQEGGIEPDIRVPQLSDPDYKTRPRFRESDLRRHLINEAMVDNSILEDDSKEDPRFNTNADALKKQGIEDFQLHYALETIGRLAKTPVQVAARTSNKK